MINNIAVNSNEQHKDVFPDPQTGLKPTQKQLDILLTLNPLEHSRTYADVADILEISESAIQNQMSKLKKRCPVVYKRFKNIKLKGYFDERI